MKLVYTQGRGNESRDDAFSTAAKFRHGAGWRYSIERTSLFRTLSVTS